MVINLCYFTAGKHFCCLRHTFQGYQVTVSFFGHYFNATTFHQIDCFVWGRTQSVHV